MLSNINVGDISKDTIRDEISYFCKLEIILIISTVFFFRLVKASVTLEDMKVC